VTFDTVAVAPESLEAVDVVFLFFVSFDFIFCAAAIFACYFKRTNIARAALNSIIATAK
jgi:hypothetical protein